MEAGREEILKKTGLILLSLILVKCHNNAPDLYLLSPGIGERRLRPKAYKLKKNYCRVRDIKGQRYSRGTEKQSKTSQWGNDNFVHTILFN